MKEVRRYQANFIGTSGAASYTFSFDRYYKIKPENIYLIKTTQVAIYQLAAATAPVIVLAQGLFDGLSSVRGVYTDTATSNDFVLGFTGFTTATTGFTSTYHNQGVMIMDVPIIPFTVAYRLLSSSVLGVSNFNIALSFEIIEMSPDE